MQISIVIITHNRANDLYELLENINDFENKELISNVVILDNASYPEIASRKLDDINVEWVRSEQNLGVSEGRNLASKYAEGDIFVYFDDDVNVNDRSALKKILASFSQELFDGREIGIVCFKVLYKATKQVQINAFPHKKYNKYKDKKAFFTYYYPGCAHAILKKAWFKTGNYPSDFFYGMEEYDFSYRLIDKDFSIKYESGIVVLHKESPFGRTTKTEKIKMMWINKSKVAWRYLPIKNFYTTAFMWSIQFLLKTRFNLKEFINGWKTIKKIPEREKRAPISNKSLQYLKKVEARLWY